MEYGLRQRPIRPSGLNGSGLNPCFNGIWSATAQEGYSWAMAKSSLNPCFNGIWSATVLASWLSRTYRDVLILVLMEYGLRQVKLRVVITLILS